MTVFALSRDLPGGASPLADDVYDAVEPLAAGHASDASRGWPLGHYVAATLQPAALADAVADDPTLLFSIERAPEALLVAVEQARGQEVDVRASEQVRRDRLMRRSAERFGRPVEIRAAIAETLLPPGEVVLFERYDPTQPDLDQLGPEARFHLTIVVRAVQVPDPVVTARAAQDAAPMRTLVHLVLSGGTTYRELADAGDTYRDLADAGITYADLTRGEKP